MPAFGDSGKAVQILRINEDHSFDLDDAQLEAILLNDRVKDKPVVVISVAGAYRQGKSFMLSFFLRYLRNNCRSDWLDDQNAPLDGFEWKHGSKPHTTGILLWDEVFLMTTPQGEEVAVLLMDTQGSFDCNSTVKDCTTVFALSIMASSVQVYNVLRNIQEDQLQHLQFFAEYGKLAQEGARNEPFQRLVFLVRDWAFPYEADYGVEGGCTVLKDRLEVVDKQHEDLQSLRRDICSSFSKVECFLMPRPGDKAEMNQAFDGRLVDIHPKFQEKLQELLPWLLAPENLVVKKVNGEKITCHELLDYFRAYAEAFRGGQLPEPKSMLQVTAEASNMAAKRKATRLYMESMEKRPHGNLERLLQAHLAAMAQAKELFRKTPKMSGEAVVQRHLEALEKELQAHFARLYKDEELFIQRERANEEKREREREEERKREAQRNMERAIEREREKQRNMEREYERRREAQWAMEREIERKRQEQWDRERADERRRENDRRAEKEKEEKQIKEREQVAQRQIDELKDRLSKMESEKAKQERMRLALTALLPSPSGPSTPKRRRSE